MRTNKSTNSGNKNRFHKKNALISVVIPTYNEAEHIISTIKNVTRNRETEIIIVDGGSSDETVALIKSTGVKVKSYKTGRAGQMNYGARFATGEFIIFLHADTHLPPDYDKHVYQTMSIKSTVAGAFRLKIDGKALSLRLVEYMTNMRSILFGMPYGDQAIFMKRALFLEMGGFPERPILEDFIFLRKLHHIGSIRIASAAALTSPRRWLQLGVFKTTFINQFIILSHFLGVPQKYLAKWYLR